MLRVFYFTSWTWTLLCFLLAGRAVFNGQEVASSRASGHGTSSPARLPTGEAREWFERVRPSCNPLEVETRLIAEPAPEGNEGSAFLATCLAIAGKVDRARTVLNGLPSRERFGAASIVFEVGHSVADSGDERSAAPLMELVLEFQPENQMAIYHLATSERFFGKRDRAVALFRKFLELHPESDILRKTAEEHILFLEGN